MPEVQFWVRLSDDVPVMCLENTRAAEALEEHPGFVRLNDEEIDEAIGEEINLFFDVVFEGEQRDGTVFFDLNHSEVAHAE